MPIMIGADPEFEIRRNGRMVEAHNLIRDPRRSAQIGLDGATSTGELRPRPGNAEQVAANLDRLIGRLASIIPGSDYQVVAGSGVDLPLGGHVHFSGVEVTQGLLDALDKFISEPLNQKSSGAASRHTRGYGRPGMYRPQPHGWEYRTPCSWIVSPSVALGVLTIAEVLSQAERVEALSTRVDLYAVAGPKAEAIQSLYRDLDQLEGSLEQVNVLSSWGKVAHGDELRSRPIQIRGPHRPRTLIPTYTREEIAPTVPVELDFDGTSFESLIRAIRMRLPRQFQDGDRILARISLRFRDTGCARNANVAQVWLAPAILQHMQQDGLCRPYMRSWQRMARNAWSGPYEVGITPRLLEPLNRARLANWLAYIIRRV